MPTTQQLSAVPRNSSGTAITGKTAAWASSNTAVATVNSTGLVSAVAPGSANITATVDGITGTSICSVAAPASASYVIQTFTPRVQVQAGQSVVIPANIAPQNGYSGAVTITAPTGLANITVEVGLSSSGSFAGSVSATNQFFIKITAASIATVGTSALNITSVGAGALVANMIVQLDVTAAAAPSLDGFFMPTTISVARGGSATATITILRNGGYTGVVVPSVESSTLRGAFPFDNPGTVTFSPASLSSGQTTCTMTVNLPAGWTSGPNDPNFIRVKLDGDSNVESKILQAITFTATG